MNYAENAKKKETYKRHAACDENIERSYVSEYHRPVGLKYHYSVECTTHTQYGETHAFPSRTAEQANSTIDCAHLSIQNASSNAMIAHILL